MEPEDATFLTERPWTLAEIARAFRPRPLSSVMLPDFAEDQRRIEASIEATLKEPPE